MKLDACYFDDIRGAVYSLEDARAVSGDDGFSAQEQRELPTWYREELDG